MGTYAIKGDAWTPVRFWEVERILPEQKNEYIKRGYTVVVAASEEDALSFWMPKPRSVI